MTTPEMATDDAREKEYHALEAGLKRVAKAWAEGKTAELAADLVVRCRKALSRAGELLKAELAPHVAEQKSIKAKWQPVTDGFAEMMEVCRGFLAEDIKAQQDEAAVVSGDWSKKRDELAERGKDLERQARSCTDADERNRLEEQAAEVWREHRKLGREKPAAASAPSGVGVRTKLTWEVVDIAQVPDNYTKRVADKASIDKALRRGIREIPGLEIREDKVPVVRE